MDIDQYGRKYHKRLPRYRICAKCKKAFKSKQYLLNHYFREHMHKGDKAQEGPKENLLNTDATNS